MSHANSTVLAIVTNPPPHPGVPIEVCEHIIGFIPNGEYNSRDSRTLREALAACCLTCRDWFPRAHLLLYQEVDLEVTEPYPRGRGSTLHRFYRCLKHTPSNGRLVQRMRVSLNTNQSSVGSGISFIALSFPHLLPNLGYINFVSPNLVNVHPKFYAALSLFRNVHTLVLDNPEVSTQDQLFRFIAAFRMLTTLQLEIPPSSVGVPVGIRRSRKLAIPHLRLWCPTTALSAAISWFPPWATSSLAVFLDDSKERDIREVQDYIQRCGKSLCHLTLEWDTSCGKIDEFDLSHNTDLRTLQLVDIPLYPYVVRDGAYTDQDLLAKSPHDVIRLLTTVSSKHLEDLDIGFLSDDLTDDGYPNILAHEWSALDSVFEQSTFCRLKRIRIGIRVGLRKVISGPAVARLLPRLASQPSANFAPFDDVSEIIDPDTLALSVSLDVDDYGDNQIVADYIKRCQGMLHELTLSWTLTDNDTHRQWSNRERDSGAIVQGLLDFSHNTNLRTLRLVSVPINRKGVTHQDTGGQGRLVEQLDLVVHLLTTVSSEYLEDLDLEFYSYHTVYVADILDYDWSALDSLLALPRFSHLERVRVGFGIGHPIGRVVVSSVADLLPQLASRPSADFTPMELSDDGAYAIVDIDALSSDSFDFDIKDEMYYQNVTDFTQHRGDSLRALRVEWQDKDVSSRILDLSHNTNLHTLQLEGRDEEQTWSSMMQSIHHAVHILSTVPSQCLEDLEVRFFRGQLTGSAEAMSVISPSGWDTLDSTFVLPMFSNLKRIHTGYAGNHWRADRPGWEFSDATLARLLPQLAGRPAADFTAFHSESQIIHPEVLAPSSPHSEALSPVPQ